MFVDAQQFLPSRNPSTLPGAKQRIYCPMEVSGDRCPPRPSKPSETGCASRVWRVRLPYTSVVERPHPRSRHVPQARQQHRERTTLHEDIADSSNPQSRTPLIAPLSWNAAMDASRMSRSAHHRSHPDLDIMPKATQGETNRNRRAQPHGRRGTGTWA